MPPKAKRATKGVAAKARTKASHGTSNLMPQASSQGHFVPVELKSHHLEPTPPQALVPPLGSTPHALTRPLAPTRQPYTTKHNGCVVVAEARTKSSHGTLNLMARTSSQGHSVPLEPQSFLLEPTPPQAPVPPLGSTPHALTRPSAPTRQPHTTKHNGWELVAEALNKSSHGTSNLMARASSQGHSLPLEPQSLLLEPTPAEAPVPPLGSTPHALAPPSAQLGSTPHALTPPSAHTQQPRATKRRFSYVRRMPSKEKRSKNVVATKTPSSVSRGTSDVMPQASSHGHSISEDPQPDLLESIMGSSVVPHGKSNLMSQASSQGDPVPVETQSDSLKPTPDALSPPLAPPKQSCALKRRSSNAGRECSRAWTVQAIDEQGNQKKIQLTNPGVFDMPQGQRIVVPFDRHMRACGEAAALLSGACGRIATDSDNIPIYFESWPKVPDSYKKECFNALKASEVIAKRYCYITMARKYRDGKLNLWKLNFKPSYSREQLIEKVPNGIPEDQWSLFVDYHLKPEYLDMCQKNAEARRKQTIPHTGGSKLLSRRQQEMEEEAGHAVGRGELYIATHKKKDGAHVNEEARSIVEQLEQQLSQVGNPTEIASNDALAKVLGPDHTGRVRGLGLGGLHSVAFASTTKRLRNVSNTDTAEPSQLKEENNNLRLKLASYEENIKTLQTVLISYIEMKEGTVPEEFSGLLGTSPADQGKENDVSTSEGGGSSLNSNRV